MFIALDVTSVESSKRMSWAAALRPMARARRHMRALPAKNSMTWYFPESRPSRSEAQSTTSNMKASDVIWVTLLSQLGWVSHFLRGQDSG